MIKLKKKTIKKSNLKTLTNLLNPCLLTYLILKIEKKFMKWSICFCVSKTFLKKFNFFLIFFLLQINIFLMFSNHFNIIILKII
jgi:hypothetical protein